MERLTEVRLRLDRLEGRARQLRGEQVVGGVKAELEKAGLGVALSLEALDVVGALPQLLAEVLLEKGDDALHGAARTFELRAKLLDVLEESGADVFLLS